MKTNNTTELINQLSDEFSRLIVEGFTADQLKDVVTKNHTEAYLNCCATHNYYDANMFMDRAFKNIIGHEINLQDDSNIDLWNAAWDLSKSLDFANGTKARLVHDINLLQRRYDKSTGRNAYTLGNKIRAKQAELAALKS